MKLKFDLICTSNQRTQQISPNRPKLVLFIQITRRLGRSWGVSVCQISSLRVIVHVNFARDSHDQISINHSNESKQGWNVAWGARGMRPPRQMPSGRGCQLHTKSGPAPKCAPTPNPTTQQLDDMSPSRVTGDENQPYCAAQAAKTTSSYCGEHAFQSLKDY